MTQSQPPANPYAPTTLVSPDAISRDDVEGYRKHYLSHEAGVKSIGLLYLFGAILMIPVGMGLIVAPLLGGTGPDPTARFIAVCFGLVYVALGILQAATAYGLRKLAPWARNIAVVFSAIGLLGFPFVTLISAYFLFMLVGKKGKVVFSEDYRDVIAQTPHIRYKTSIIVWLLLGVLVLLIGFGMIGMMIG